MLSESVDGSVVSSDFMASMPVAVVNTPKSPQIVRLQPILFNISLLIFFGRELKNNWA